jgi:hypothetical protein
MHAARPSLIGSATMTSRAAITRWRLVRATAFLLLGALASARPAAADDSKPPTKAELERARANFLAAEELERSGKYEAALQAFQKVYETKQSASVRFHLGYCNESLGKFATAYSFFLDTQEQARREGKADIMQSASEAMERVKPKRSYLTASCIDACELAIDNMTMVPDNIGHRIPYDAGLHRLTGRREKTGEISSVDVTLTPGEERKLVIEWGPAVKVNVLPQPSAQADQPVATARQPGETPHSIVAPIVTSVSAALAIGGGALLYALAGSAQSQARLDCPARLTCSDERSNVRTLDALSLTTFGVGAALTGISIFLWIRKATEPAVAGWAPRTWPFALSGKAGQVR